MSVDQLQDYTTVVWFGFFTLLITVIYCFHCKIPNLKYWSI